MPIQRICLITSIICLLIGHHTHAHTNLDPIEKLIQQQRYHQVIKNLSEKKGAENTAETLYLLGQSHLAFSNFNEAEKLFSEGIRSDPSFSLNYIGMAQVHKIAGDTAKVRSMIDRSMLNQGSLEAGFKAAQIYLDLDLLNEAEALKDKLLAKAPEDPRVYVLWGDYFVKNGVHMFGISQYMKALEKDPTYIEAYRKMIRVQFVENNTDFIFSYYDKAQKIDSLDAGIQLAMSEGFSSIDSVNEAKEYYNKYLQLANFDPYAQLKYVRYLFSIGEIEGASEIIKALADKKELNTVLIELAKVQLQTGNAAQAFQTLSPYIKSVQEKFLSNEELILYGKILFEMGNYGSASYYYSQAVTKSHDLTTIRPYYGELRRQQNAGEKLQSALEIESDFWRQFSERGLPFTIQDYHDYGTYLRAEGEYKKSEEQFNKILELKKGHLRSLVMIFKIRQDLEDADTTSFKGLAKLAAENVIDKINSLSKKQVDDYKKSLLIEAYAELAEFHMLSKAEQAGGCQKVESLVSKMLSVEPKNKEAIELGKACMEQTKKSNQQ